MSVTHDYATGTWHLSIRLMGDPKKIETFHGLMYLLESDWPWKPEKRNLAVGTVSRGHYNGNYRPSVRVCDTCCGATISNPRIAPADIRAAAIQCGVKVKVDRMAPAEHCYTEGTTYSPISSLSQDEGRIIYQHKARRLRIESNYVLVGNETVEMKRQQMISSYKHTHGPVLVMPGSVTVQ